MHVLTLVLLPPPHDFVQGVQSVHSVYSGHLSSPQVSVSSGSPSHSS